jgi:damage-control phosphatase, subfamily I
MKASFDCIPCLIRQTIDAARLGTDKEDLQRQVVDRVMAHLQQMDYTLSPPEIGKQIFKIIHELTGCEDPYRDFKLRSNTFALNHYSAFKRQVYLSDDPVLLAAKLAVSGNPVDFAGDADENLVEQMLYNTRLQKFAVDDYINFLEDITGVHNILYLADNAGEIVFDKLFIEVLQRFYPERNLNFTVVVRGAPIINDATREDARLINLDKVAQVVDNGDNSPATVLHRVSKEMKNLYRQAELVVSKGQGNWETLHEQKKLIYFLFKVRCPLISEVLKVDEGGLVFQRSFCGKKDRRR